MKKTLKFFNNSLKGLISLSILLCSFSAYSGPVWDDDILEVIELSNIMDVPTEIFGAYVWKEEGVFWGVNHFIHFHRRGDEWRTWLISKEEYMTVKNNIGTGRCLMIPFIDPHKPRCFF